MTTIATTQNDWKVKVFFVGKAKDMNLFQNEHKKGATSAATEITQEKQFLKNNITNYNTNIFAKKGIA